MRWAQLDGLTVKRRELPLLWLQEDHHSFRGKKETTRLLGAAVN